MSEKDDKAGWEAINEDPEKLSKWMEYMRTKTSLTECETECPECGALIGVTQNQKYCLVNCHYCHIDLEYNGKELITIEDDCD